jgi:predicted permease
LAYGILLRPLPFYKPEQLFAINEDLQSFGENEVVPASDVVMFERQMRSIRIAGFKLLNMELSGRGEPLETNVCRITGYMFPTLGVGPLLGRTFTQAEDEQSEPFAVLSYGFWQNYFNKDPKAIGSKILLERKPYLIIGVMPRTFEFPLQPGHLSSTEIWIPMSFTQSELTTLVGGFQFSLVGRLEEHMSLSQAEIEAHTIAHDIDQSRPQYLQSVYVKDVVLHPLSEQVVGDARPLVRVLVLSVLTVLLIACTNLAGLLLVRAIHHRREFAVRLALGATISALLFQTVSESLILTLGGGALGIIASGLTLHLFVRALPETLPRVGSVQLNSFVVASTLVLSVVTGICCALVPTVAAARTPMNDTLKEGGRTGSSGTSHVRLRSTLVVLEIAVAFVLLAAAGLLIRSFQKIRTSNPGFRSDHAVIAQYSLPVLQYPTQSAVNAFSGELRRRLKRLPGVRYAALTTGLPLTDVDLRVFVPSASAKSSAELPGHGALLLNEGNYFESLRIPLIAGRYFADTDAAGAPLVAIVNQSLADDYWPEENPIGKHIRLGTQDMQTPWITIVGEVSNVKQQSIDAADQHQLYLPVSQYRADLGSFASKDDVSGRTMFVVLGTQLSPETFENVIRLTIRSLDPQLAITQVQTMDEAVSRNGAPRKFNTVVIAAFASVAVFLVILGIYGVIAFTAATRAQEMAIRMALGAERQDIVYLVLRSGVTLGSAGCVLGLVLSFLTLKLISGLLFQVRVLDALNLSLAGLSILLFSLLASLGPAARAASVKVVDALRN